MALDMAMSVDAVRLAMSVEELRAKVAANNIAMANMPGSRPQRFDSAAALSGLRASRDDGELFAQALGELQASSAAPYLHELSSASPVALDAEVSEMSDASARYQTLADAATRQYALMSLAIKGER